MAKAVHINFSEANVRLENAKNILSLQRMSNLIHVLALDGGICFENAVYDISGKIVFKAITAVRLRLNISQKGTRNTCGGKLRLTLV